ncbi:FANCI solenoid 4-domain-containing protein [Syncephalis fuscata]|nr:FANCI solenoid 4-domain-containing protein [Syncephalis fuscata]
MDVIQTTVRFLKSTLEDCNEVEDPLVETSDADIEQGLQLLLQKEYSNLDKEQRLGCARTLLNAALGRSEELLASESTTLLDRLFQVALEWLREGSADDSDDDYFAEQLVNLWIPHIQMISQSTLIGALDVVTIWITSESRLFTCITSLYASLLYAASNSTALSTDGRSKPLSGLYVNSKQESINVLSKADIPPRLLVPLVTAFHTVPLAGEQFELLLTCFQRHLPLVLPDELPTFVYQLVLYAIKAPRIPIIPNMLEFFATYRDCFSEMDEIARQSIEGTVAFHLCFSMSQDSKLMELFIKSIKKDTGLLCSSFTVVCLCLIARNHRYQDQIMEMLKSFLINNARVQHRLLQAPWLRDYTELKANLWEKMLTESIEQVAHSLLTSTLEQCCPMNTRFNTTLNDTLVGLANQLIVHLAQLFVKCEASRQTILDIVIERLIAHLPSTYLYAELLGQIVDQAGATLLEYTHMIKELNSLMPMLSPSIIRSLFTSLSTIYVSNQMLRDDLLMTARKYLFSRDTNGQENALQALVFLINLDLTPAFMNADRIQMYRNELISLIGRCTQSTGILQAKSLASLSLLVQKRPECILSLADYLLRQATITFQLDATEPDAILNGLHHMRRGQSAINSDNIVGNNNKDEEEDDIRDPLPQLLILISQLYELFKSTNNRLEEVKQCQSILTTIVTRLSDTPVADYRLTRNLDRTPALDEIQRITSIQRLLALYESAMVTALCNFSKVDAIETIRSVVSKHCQAYALLRDKSTKGCSCILQTTKLTSMAVHKLCKKLIQHSDASLRFGYRVHLLKMLVATAITHAHKLSCTEQDINITKSVAQLLFLELEECAKNERRFLAGSSDILVCSQGLHNLLLKIMNKSDDASTRIVDLFIDLDSTTPNINSKQVIINLLTRLESMINALFERGACMQKEIALIVDLYEFIRKHCLATEPEHAINWKRQVTSNYGIDDSQLSRSLVNAILATEAGSATLNCHATIATDIKLIRGNIGTIYEEPESQMEMTFSLVNDQTSLIVFRAILESTDANIEELQYCVNHWSKPRFSVELGKDVCLIESYGYVLQRMKAICEVCITAQQTYIVGPMADRLTQTLQRAYKLLGSITRKALTLNIRPGQEMKALIETAGGPLSQHLYQFITYVQQHDGAQSNHGTNSSENGKRKKNKDKPLTKKARISRELRAIPMLIFTVEQFEKHIIALSKQSKVDLVYLLKRSTARDFRIQIQRIIIDETEEQEAQEEGEEEEEQGQQHEEEQEEQENEDEE